VAQQKKGSTDWTEKVDIKQFRDEIKTFLFAGHETSSMMLTWALYETIVNKDVEKKVLEESYRVWGDTNDTTNSKFYRSDGEIPETGKDIHDSVRDGLKYTQNVLREALRKYSIVPVVTRQAVEDEQVGDYFFPKGSKIAIPIRAIHYRKDLWGDPENFRPERFEEKMDEFSWLGFIAGRRQCVGQQFALLETKIVLSLFLNRFELSIAPGYEDSVHRHPFNIPIGPENGLRLLIRRRNTQQ